MTAILDMNVRAALAHGMALVPVTAGQKRPRFSYSPITDFSAWKAMQRSFGPDINAAIHLNSSNLCVIDLDTPDAFARLTHDLYLPPTMAVRTMRGMHLYYRRPHDIGDSGNIYYDPDTPDQPMVHVGEFICGNNWEHYAMLPGSVRDDGGVYRWHVHFWHGIAMLPDDVYRVILPDSIAYDEDR